MIKSTNREDQYNASPGGGSGRRNLLMGGGGSGRRNLLIFLKYDQNMALFWALYTHFWVQN
jgi:hypothetical protein